MNAERAVLEIVSMVDHGPFCLWYDDMMWKYYNDNEGNIANADLNDYDDDDDDDMRQFKEHNMERAG